MKKELADRGLPTKGNKSDLQARLEKCLSEQGECAFKARSLIGSIVFFSGDKFTVLKYSDRPFLTGTLFLLPFAL